MKYNPEIHKRRSLRFKNYNYAQQGAYFVTICTKYRECLFGEIVSGEMVLNAAGDLVRKAWDELQVIYQRVETDQFIIMPNHVHGIILFNAGKNRNRRGLINQPPTWTTWIMMKNPEQTLGKIIRHFKAKSSKIIRERSLNRFQWQRNYYDHIIRNEKELMNIREYIRNNPVRWDRDTENPAYAGV
jgi:REP element-mobilizing transposase RayT